MEDTQKCPAWQSQYLVTDKLDGERFFLYFDTQSAYLIDRRLNVFISYLSTGDFAGTLLDGELLPHSATKTIEDDVLHRKRKRSKEEAGHEEQTETELHFVAFDVLSLNGVNATKLPFKDRMDEAKLRLSELGLPQACTLPLKIHYKRYLPLNELPNLLKRREPHAQLPIFSESATFLSDGLIFQNALSPYWVGHSDNLLKWKDLKHNTIDLRLLPVDIPTHFGTEYANWWQGCVVNKAGHNCHFDWIKLDSPKDQPAEDGSTQNKEETPKEGDIVECWWDSTRQLDHWYYMHWYGENYAEQGYGRGGWRVYRQRKDKDTPNVDWVAKKVWESIVQQITLDQIVAAVHKV